MLNQRKAGLKIRPDEVVEMPPELKKYEQMKATGLPVWDGGLQDQPHIWLEMVGVIVAMKRIFAELDKQAGESEE
jgi:hypothetical protein